MLLAQGARLVDVRSQHEFARGSLDHAINLPLENLHELLDEFRDGLCLLFCASGTRSQIAVDKLRAAGIDHAYNLGSLERGSRLVS